MKRIIILMIVLALLTLSTCACGGGGSASDVAKAFYKAGNGGDYEKAKSYLSIHAQMGLEALSPLGMAFESAMDAATKDGTIVRIQVKGGEEYPGGYQASMYLTLHYADGSQEQDFLMLQKEDGRWKILESTLLITGAFK